MIITKYSEITDRESSENIAKLNMIKPMNNDELRLFFIDLLFLTKYAKTGDKIVYIGCSNILYLCILSNMFPDCTFDIWTMAGVEMNPEINMIVNKRIFTDKDASDYKSNSSNILFVSNSCDFSDYEIGINMSKQRDWCKIINPKIALLKFRPDIPITSSKSSFEYLTGTLYLQPYSTFSSTDTVLSTSDYESTKEYDITEYNEKLTYHNIFNRKGYAPETRWTPLMREAKIDNKWDNVYALYITYMYLNLTREFPEEIDSTHSMVIDEFLNIVNEISDIDNVVCNMVFDKPWEILPKVLSEDISLEYDAIGGRSYYDKSAELCKTKKKTTMHLGQTKLFFSELLFLGRYARKGDLILYVGAAPGFHIAKLADLFPDCIFDLWDPRAYTFEPRNNIKINTGFFTNKICEAYRNLGDKCLFMCDMRDQAVGGVGGMGTTNDESDIIVSGDMRLQKDWARIIKPRYSYLKFRLSYAGRNMMYFGGPIYLQPFAPISNETRLLVSNYKDLVEYDAEKYDDILAYHNGYNRCRTYKKTPWTNLLIEYDLYSGWDNIAALEITLEFLIKRYNADGPSDDLRVMAVRFFIEVAMYHRDEYWSKDSGDDIEKIFGFNSDSDIFLISKKEMKANRRKRYSRQS